MKNIIIMFLLLVGLNLSAQEEHQKIKGKVSPQLIPGKVSLKVPAVVTASRAKLVDEVN